MLSKKKIVLFPVLLLLLLFCFCFFFRFFLSLSLFSFSFLQACVLSKSVQTVCNELEKKKKKKEMVIEIFSH